MRKRSPAAIQIIIACVVLLGALTTAYAKAPEIFPLSKVRRGLKGYGLTVFQGTTPERFEFEVVDVVRNALPRMDLILVKSADPKIRASGFARGMSGSPLFIEGKVACAFAYAYPFSKESIGGCTPIEYMLGAANHPVRGPDATAMADASEWKKLAPLQALARGGESHLPGQRERSSSWLLGAPLPTPPSPRESASGLVRAGIPLAVSGLGPTAIEQAKELFRPYGIEPTQGGGSGSPVVGPTSFEMGGAIGAELARGDVSMVGTGTVSYVDGNTVLAFGHPFFQYGEVYMPAVTAEIHAVIASQSMSFKVSSPLRELGSVVQDRQSGIVIDTSQRVSMIPVQVNVRGPEGQESFRGEVLRHRFLTPPLVGVMAANAAQLLAPDVSDVTVMVSSRLQIRGYQPLSFMDYQYAPDGPGKAIAAAQALRVLVPLLFNPFAPVRIDRIDIDVDLAYKADVTEIVGLRTTDPELPYDRPTSVELELRPFDGPAYSERIPLSIPARLAGSTVRIEAIPGDRARPDTAPPESLDDVIEALRKVYPANTIVISVYTADEGALLAGRVIPHLPDSALDTIQPAGSTRRGVGYKCAMRVVVPATRVVTGKQELIVRIRELRR
ncbi:MAG: hypothetical protein V2A73_18115 [Pseudomonadota bacterium]